MLHFNYTGIYMALYLTFGINDMAIKTSRSSVFFQNMGKFLTCKIMKKLWPSKFVLTSETSSQCQLVVSEILYYPFDI